MEARRTTDGVVINGSKKPCSLTWSMDLLTASVRVVDAANHTDKLAVVLIPATAGGLQRERYWNNWLLGGAESPSAADRTRMGIDIEGAAAALEGIARSMMANPRGEDELARMLFVRYSVQNAIERATALAFELLGGIAFSQSSEVSYLFNAAHALGLHPPSRSSMAEELANFMSGRTYKIK